MTEPILTLHAPKRHDRFWVLGIDVNIGGDTITLSARISPKTMRWAQAYGAKALSYLHPVWQRAQSAFRNNVDLDGDWTRFGALAAGAFDLAQRVAASPLSRIEDMTGPAKFYRACQGELGPHAHKFAVEQVKKIEADADAGNDDAIAALKSLYAVVSMDGILNAEDCYDQLRRLGALAAGGDEEAARLLSACKALGRCCCGGPVEVNYDLGDQLLKTDGADWLAGYASDVLTFRGYKRAPLRSLAETATAMRAQRRRILPGIAPAPRYDALGSAMPYYSAGHNTDEDIHGSRGIAGGYLPDADYMLNTLNRTGLR